MIHLKTSKITEILKGRLLGSDLEISGAHNDTRALTPGNLYFAIKGIQLDGHDFIAQAEAAGASALVVEHEVKTKLPQIIVADGTLAMGQLAKYWREQFKIPFVGITGSVGKTTTRQMLAAILSQAGSTLVSEGNKNNFYGVPLTLFRLSPEHRYAVIEMGADRPDDIQYLTEIVQPDVATVTMVAPVHLHVAEGIGFGSIEGVLEEKTKIFLRLTERGVAVLNADSPYFKFWTEKLTHCLQISFAFKNTADVTASDLHPNDTMRYEFTLHTPLGKTQITLSSLGRHNVNNALCASACALSLGLNLGHIQQGLAQVPTVERRMIRKSGLNDSIIIDDSYNANIVATKAIIEMLGDFKDKKKIMVFGDMRELGELSRDAHIEIAEHAKKSGIDYFFAYGPESVVTIETLANSNAQHFENHDALIKALIPLLDKETIVIVKGSHAMQMNKVVEQICKEK